MAVGRPKGFDEREVVEKAMELFWLRGYDAVGMAELLRHMGISRQSLYSTFGSKRGLFLRCIQHYRETQLSTALALLQQGGRTRIENVKEVVRFFEELARSPDCRGCLVANALVEMGPRDPEIAEVLRETLGLLQGGIEAALEEAQQRGELAPGRSPRELSQALLNAVIGMAVTGRVGLGQESLREIYAGTLSMLG